MGSGKRLSIPIGSKYDRLTVISELPKTILPSGQKIRTMLCGCDCGKTISVILLHLVRHRIKSCGCINKTRGGESQTHLFKKWKSIVERCQSNYIHANNYFDRGITVCDEWANDFLAFKKWAIENGYKKELTIDREDNNKGYYPDNCRFITAKGNCNNRRCTQYVKYNRKKYPFKSLCELLNISPKNEAAIRGRINRGWDHQLAFDTPIKTGSYK